MGGEGRYLLLIGCLTTYTVRGYEVSGFTCHQTATITDTKRKGTCAHWNHLDHTVIKLCQTENAHFTIKTSAKLTNPVLLVTENI